MGALALVAALLPGAARSALPTSGTILYLNSQPGDPLGGGLEQTFTGATATFGAHYDGSNVFVNVYSPLTGAVWQLEFSAPLGSGGLVPATYTNVARSPFRAWGQAGIDIIGPSGGCNTESGGFTVNQAVFGPVLPSTGYLRVITFDATFEDHCNDLEPALTGQVRYEDPPDTTPPSLSPLGDITTEAEDSTGTTLYYSYLYASDGVDPNPQVVCDPPPASRFPIGETTVTCTATDYSGNSANESFKVTVLAPLEYTFTIESIGSVNTKTGVATIGGTLTCSRPGTLFVSYGQVVQTFAHRVTLTGPFSTFGAAVSFDCSLTSNRWSMTAVPPDGRFGAGKAHVEVSFAGACDLYRCFYFTRSKDIVLRAK